VDYLFNPSKVADLSDIEVDVALTNVRRMQHHVKVIMDKFEASPHYHQLVYDNEWVNHPDEYYVPGSVYKDLFKEYFGDIGLQHFLTEYGINQHTFSTHSAFHKNCQLFYSAISFHEVECVQEKLNELYARLCMIETEMYTG
jgi:hypothetical protein